MEQGEHTKGDSLVRKESQVLVRGILLHITVRRAKEGNEHIDEDDGGQEIP